MVVSDNGWVPRLSASEINGAANSGDIGNGTVLLAVGKG